MKLLCTVHTDRHCSTARFLVCMLSCHSSAGAIVVVPSKSAYLFTAGSSLNIIILSVYIFARKSATSFFAAYDALCEEGTATSVCKALDEIADISVPGKSILNNNCCLTLSLLF